MDFFEHQEQARKKTHVLVFYFLLAVLGIVASIYFLAIAIIPFVDDGARFNPWQPGILLTAAAVTGTVVFLASSFKTMQLSGGGKVVAQELGGRKVDPNTIDFHERRLINVVEEMAIASGVPVPDLYVMDNEESINAFAAGKTTSDAVIGVTRGCMKLLTRDELQGVIAHEFSHILNGDMRLNMRLMGIIFGILFISLIGEFILRGMTYVGRGSRSREGGGAILVILAAGLGLFVIGYVGLFFANLIKASVSRQREYLADASAVQFTRNPDGLAGALKKIGGLSAGSKMSHPMSRDASHMFFGSAFRSSVFATHPPLPVRIKRLLPSWDGKFAAANLPPITERDEPEKRKTPPALPNVPVMIPGMMLAEQEAPMKMTEGEAMESMRSVHPEQVALSTELLDNFPAEWITAARSGSGAQALVFALLLAQDDALRNSELSQLRNATEEETFAAVTTLHTQIRDIHSAAKLGLIDLCIPSLRQLSPAEYKRFKQLLDGLIASDRQVDLFEFALLRVVNRHLDTYFGLEKTPRVKFLKIHLLEDETSVLLSTMAAMSNPGDDTAIEAAFAAGAGHILEVSGSVVRFASASECGLDSIGKALDQFAMASPIVKRQLLEACSKSVMTDEMVSSAEAELIRAIADAMGCPIPPFVRTAALI